MRVRDLNSLALLVAIALPSAGCGLGWIDGSTSDQGLPTLGAGPYARFDPDDTTTADEPWVLQSQTADYSHATVLPLPGGGTRMWFTTVDATTHLSTIDTVDVPDVHTLVTAAPSIALFADEDWEEGRVAAPSVVDTTGQDSSISSALVMFYEGGVAHPAIGHAVSTDNGRSWTKGGSPFIMNAKAPGAFVDHGVWSIFVTRTDNVAPGIWRAGAGNALTSGSFDVAPIVSPEIGVTGAFDNASVSEPFALITQRDTGTSSRSVWFVGTNDATQPQSAIGYVGTGDDSTSQAGSVWVRFGTQPVLPPSAHGPAVILSPSSGLMFYDDVQRGHSAIAAAHTP